MSKKPLPKIKYLGELRDKATDEGPLRERYENLAKIAASNLGQPCETLEKALESLDNMAWETDEDGTVGEINFVRDIEAKRA